MIRAAAKNFRDLVVIAAKDDYSVLNNMLLAQNGTTTIEQRKSFAAKAFEVRKTEFCYKLNQILRSIKFNKSLF